jgi:hypothetical protein
MQRDVGVAARGNHTAGRVDRQPVGDREELDRQTVVQVRRILVVGHSEADRLVAVLDADGVARERTGQGQVLVHHLAARIEDDLEGVAGRARPAGVVLDVRVLDDEARAVVVRGRVLHTLEVEIVPERREHVGLAAGAGHRVVGQARRRRRREGHPAVRREVDLVERVAVEREVEGQRERSRGLVVPVEPGDRGADRRDVEPVENRSAGLVAVLVAVAALVRASGALDVPPGAVGGGVTLG